MRSAARKRTSARVPGAVRLRPGPLFPAFALGFKTLLLNAGLTFFHGASLNLQGHILQTSLRYYLNILFCPDILRWLM